MLNSERRISLVHSVAVKGDEPAVVGASADLTGTHADRTMKPMKAMNRQRMNPPDGMSA
jgi:hypothetical protein